MANGDDFKAGEFQGKVIGELESLKANYTAFAEGQKSVHESIERLASSLDSFKTGIGERTGKNEKDIAKIEVGQGIMGKVMWVIATVVAGSIVTSIMGFILKTH